MAIFQQAFTSPNLGSTIADMKIVRVCVIVLWFVRAYPCVAQLWNASQYRDYMSGLDAAAERWQGQIGGIDIGRLNLSYAKGKLIDDWRRETLSDLKSIRFQIAAQRQGEAHVLEFDRRLTEEIRSGLDPKQKADPKIREAFKPMVYVEPLTTDLDIEEKMGETRLDLTNLIDALPSQDEGLFAQGSLLPIMTELFEQQIKLQSHVHAYAEQLESKATNCPK
jgi:hypothetical protein